MNKTLYQILLVLLPFNSLLAGHYIGGEIYYSYAYNNSNNEEVYNVYMGMYSPLIHVAPTLDITSSCFPPTTKVMQAITPFQWIDSHACTQIPASTTGFRYYKAQVTLPGKCSDWSFSFTNRISGYINVQGQDITIAATLNNNITPNSTAIILDRPNNKFCLSNNDYTWYQRFFEPDGDSVEVSFFAFDAYNPGFSVDTPIGKTSGIIYDYAVGAFNFKPEFALPYFLDYEIKEYAFNTTTSNWEFKGSARRNTIIYIDSSCGSNVLHWNLNDGVGGSLGINGIQLECGTKRFAISTSRSYKCNTLVPTDFALYNSSGSTVPIIKAEGNCQWGMADSIYFELFQPISYNDTFKLESRNGIDGNTIVNACGFKLPVGQELEVIVNDCSGIGLNEDPSSTYSVYPNPAKEKVNFQFIEERGRQISMYTYDGQLIKQYESSSFEFEIDMNNYKPGAYIFQIRDGSQVYFERIIHL